MQKGLRVMRLILLFLILGLNVVNASKTYSQSTFLSLKLKNTTLKNLFSEIEKNSEYIFFYNDNAVDLNKKVSISADNETIEQILNESLKGSSTKYKIVDRQVVLYSSKDAVSEKSLNFNAVTQQQKRIQGNVKDRTGEALIGVSVIVEGTTIGTATDIEGNFSINIPSSDATLQFTYIGYTTKKVPVGNNTFLNVILLENATAIEEVVVTAPIGVQRQPKALGYSASTISAKQLTESGNTNFASALYGKASGVKITTAPGGSSSAVNVQVRGINSLNYNQQPLYVVDGVMIRNDGQNGARGANNNNFDDDQRIRGNGALDINPSDIETMTILKGASATALYGSDASSGVVVITTKKGAEKKGLGIDFSYNGTIEQVTSLPKYQNTYGPGYDRETNIANGATAEGWIADSSSPTGYRPYFRAYGQFGPKMEGQEVMWWDGNVRSYSAQPDNYKDIYQTGFSSNANIAISNQTDKFNYRLSYSRLDYEGTQRGSEQGKNSFNLNSTLKLHDNISADIVVSYVNTKTQNRPYQLGQVLGSYGGFFSRAEDMSLMLDKYRTSDGYKYVTYDRPERSDEHFIYNIRATNLLDFFWHQLRNKYEEKEDRLMSSANLNWKIVDHLNFRGRIGNDYTGVKTESKEHNEYPIVFNSGSSTGNFSISSGIYSILYGDALLTFDNKIGNDFSFSVSAGFQGRTEEYNDQYQATSQGLIIENDFRLTNSYGLINNGLNNPNNLLTKRQSLMKYAYLGILNLSYKDYLFVEGTARQEYASTLPPDNNSYFYPSVNASFVFTDAFEMPEFMNYGKLRASYGIVGNAPPAYESNIAYSQSALQTINGSVPALILPSSYGNNTLTAEKKYEKEFGLEARFLESKIGFDVSYYTNNVKDQIMKLSTAGSVGAEEQIMNIGEIGSNGWEFGINATPFRGDFSWTTRFNIAFNKTKVKSLAEGIDQLVFYNAEQGAVRVVARAGEELGNIYVYPRATDDNGNFLISDDGYYVIDKTKYEKVGNIMPKAVGGFSNSFSYKDFILDFTIDYRIGGQMISNPTKYGIGSGLYESTLEYRDSEHGGLTYVADGVTYHDGVLLQGVNQNTGEVNTKVIQAAEYYMNTFGWGADAWNEKGSVFDNSFIKMREIVLGYNVPSSVTKKLHFNNLRVSLIGRNLFYFWKTLDNVDPEAPLGNKWWSQGIDVGSTAATRSFGFSVNASF